MQLLSRRNALHERAQSRRAALEDSFHLQQFFRDSDELKSWINEKMKTATDEAYKVASASLGGGLVLVRVPDRLCPTGPVQPAGQGAETPGL